MSAGPPSLRRDVLVTGLGAVTPYGWSSSDLAQALRTSRLAIARITRFDVSRHRTQLAGEVPPAEPSSGRIRLSHSDRYALAAATEALADAGLERPALRGAGLFFSSSTGGLFESERWLAAARQERRAAHAIGQLEPQQLNAPTDAIARTFGLGGPVQTISSACASATIALASALDALRAGEVDVALAGGADALSQVTHGGFNALRSVDERPCRPLRADRAGLTLGEGAGVLVLESAEHAARRGARALAVLAGAGVTCDAHHMTAPEASGAGPARAMQEAIDAAGIDADAVDFVNLHGTGTPHNDAAERAALGRVFGARAARLPVTATKSRIGHLLGAAGAVEAIATILDLAEQRVHATLGEGPVDPELDVDLVQGEPRPLPGAGCALSTNLGFGGASAAVLLARAEP